MTQTEFVLGSVSLLRILGLFQLKKKGGYLRWKNWNYIVKRKELQKKKQKPREDPFFYEE